MFKPNEIIFLYYICLQHINIPDQYTSIPQDQRHLPVRICEELTSFSHYQNMEVGNESMSAAGDNLNKVLRNTTESPEPEEDVCKYVSSLS